MAKVHMPYGSTDIPAEANGSAQPSTNQYQYCILALCSNQYTRSYVVWQRVPCIAFKWLLASTWLLGLGQPVSQPATRNPVETRLPDCCAAYQSGGWYGVPWPLYSSWAQGFYDWLALQTDWSSDFAGWHIIWLIVDTPWAFDNATPILHILELTSQRSNFPTWHLYFIIISLGL